MTAVRCRCCGQRIPSAEELIEAKIAELLKRCDKHDIVIPDDGYLDEHDAATALRLSWDRLRALRYEGKLPSYRRASRRRVEYSLSDLAIFEINRSSEEISS